MYPNLSEITLIYYIDAKVSIVLNNTCTVSENDTCHFDVFSKNYIAKWPDFIHLVFFGK